MFGLIFLFEYIPGSEQADEEEDASEVWFANQVNPHRYLTVSFNG